MKYKSLVIVISITFIALGACIRQQSPDNRLVQIDSLLRPYPDSALCLLENIDPDSLSGKESQVYYALLLVQARDKKMIPSLSDSLIHIAVQHYDSIGDVSMQARAHYLWAGHFRDQRDEANAIREYLLSLELAQKANDRRLLSVLYNNMGCIYYRQDLNEQADSVYLRAEHLAVLLKDSALLAEALAYRGMIQLEKGKIYYPTAEKRLIQAYEIADSLRQYAILSDITSNLSILYSRMNNGLEALRFAKEYMALQDNGATFYDSSFLLGDAYYKCQEKDSAIYYLAKSLLSNSLYVKSGGYMRLADIFREQGEYKKSLEMERQYSAYMDSIKLARQDKRVLIVEKNIQLEHRQAKYHSSTKRYWIYLIVLSGILLSIVYYLRSLYKKRILRLRSTQTDLQSKNATLQQELKVNQEKNVSLQTRIEQINDSIEAKSRLQDELKQLNCQRAAILEEDYKFSEVYSKMNRMIKSYKQMDCSEESFSEDDWKQLVFETDKRWPNLTIRLKADYFLSQEDVNLCCLFLTTFPTKHLGYILECSRDNVYKKIYALLDKMKQPHKMESLENILQEYMKNTFTD